MVTTARRVRRLRIVILDEPTRLPTLDEIEAREAANEAAVPQLWLDEQREAVARGMVSREEATLWLARGSRCCAADACVLDGHCPFVTSCRSADAAG